MRGFLWRFLINLLLLGAIAWLFPGIRIASLSSLIFAALIFGVLNAFLRPILILLTLPLTILTLGLFTFVINALMLWIASAMVRGFEIRSFWTALAAVFVYSILSLMVTMFLSDAGKIEVIHFRSRI